MRSNLLKNIRESAGLNQKDLAQQLGISIATVSQIENGIIKIDKYVPELIKLFDCTEDQLLGETPITISKTKKELADIRRVNVILLCTRKNLTPSKIANALGVNRAKITAFQGGYKDLSDENYKKIAQLLDVSVEELSQEPQFFKKDNFTKKRDKQYIIEAAIELLEQIDFPNVKDKSKMFPIAYDIMDDCLSTKNISVLEKNLELKELQIKMEKKAINQLKQLNQK